jgi:hypothetical protein
MKKKLFLVFLMLFSPALALAADECCFHGPGKCTEINFADERATCERTQGNVVLDYACKEAPECQLSEEPPARPKSTSGSQTGKAKENSF